MNWPWFLRANNWLKSAVLSPPKCIIPVGDGAYLTLTVKLKSNLCVRLIIYLLLNGDRLDIG